MDCSDLKARRYADMNQHARHCLRRQRISFESDISDEHLTSLPSVSPAGERGPTAPVFVPGCLDRRRRGSAALFLHDTTIGGHSLGRRGQRVTVAFHSGSQTTRRLATCDSPGHTQTDFHVPEHIPAEGIINAILKKKNPH